MGVSLVYFDRYQKGKIMAYIKRYEITCGRSTPLVEWHVMLDGKLIRECRTKREALEWLEVYN